MKAFAPLKSFRSHSPLSFSSIRTPLWFLGDEVPAGPSTQLWPRERQGAAACLCVGSFGRGWGPGGAHSLGGTEAEGRVIRRLQSTENQAASRAYEQKQEGTELFPLFPLHPWLCSPWCQLPQSENTKWKIPEIKNSHSFKLHTVLSSTLQSPSALPTGPVQPQRRGCLIFLANMEVLRKTLWTCHPGLSSNLHLTQMLWKKIKCYKVF